MSETQTAFGVGVWQQARLKKTPWQTDRDESEIRQMQDDRRAVWKIVQELKLKRHEDGLLVWMRRQGV